ncbi:MAG: hypothetical protein R2794_11735 [Chitinophagales bacterium]
MEYTHYLELFNNAAASIDKQLLQRKNLLMHVGVTLQSVVFKLYKAEWTSDSKDPLNAPSRIFFAIWVNEETLRQDKIYYNIHAFKLRELKGYSIKSRDFAEKFRQAFKAFEHQWEHVSVQFGPLTLMEGWKFLDKDDLGSVIEKWAYQFLQIEYIIDELLDKYLMQKSL